MKVKDVMTTTVLTVRTDTTLKDAAAMMAEHGISGLPVVDLGGQVVGVVSEGDILFKEAGRAPKRPFVDRLLSLPPSEREAKLAAATVGEAMTAPALTIAPTRPLTKAASMMLDQGVKRLPVIDEAGNLVGIVTRADLVRAFVRSDSAIEQEIREDVIRRSLWIEPDMIEVEVHAGEVRLAGQVETKAEAELVPEFVQRVPGVVSVLSKLNWKSENGEPGEDLALFEQPLVDRVAHELGPGPEPELLHDVRAVRLRRAHRDVEHLRDLLVRVPERQQAHDLAFPVGEWVGLLARLLLAPRPRPAALRAPGGRSGLPRQPAGSRRRPRRRQPP